MHNILYTIYTHTYTIYTGIVYTYTYTTYINMYKHTGIVQKWQPSAEKWY